MKAGILNTAWNHTLLTTHNCLHQW